MLKSQYWQHTPLIDHILALIHLLPVIFGDIPAIVGVHYTEITNQIGASKNGSVCLIAGLRYDMQDILPG
jgi:hypothetical protein